MVLGKSTQLTLYQQQPAEKKEFIGYIVDTNPELKVAGYYHIKTESGVDLFAEYPNYLENDILVPNTKVKVYPVDNRRLTIVEVLNNLSTSASDLDKVAKFNNPDDNNTTTNILTVPPISGISNNEGSENPFVGPFYKVDVNGRIKSFKSSTKFATLGSDFTINNGVIQQTGNETNEIIGDKETIDTKPIQKHVRQYNSLKLKINRISTITYQIASGEVVPFSDALGISEDESREFLSKILPYNDAAKLLQDFNKIYTDVIKFVDKGLEIGLAVIDTINWLEEGALPYINSLVENFGQYEFSAGPVKLSLNASLGNDLTSFVNLNTGIPIADAFLEKEINKYLQKVLPKINLGEELGIPGFSKEYKGPPPGNVLLPASIRLPVPSNEKFITGAEKLEMSSKKLEFYKENFADIPVIGTVAFPKLNKEEDTSTKPAQAGASRQQPDYNKNTRSTNQQLALPEFSYPSFLPLSELNDLNYVEYPHHGLGLLLSLYSIPAAGGLTQSLYDFFFTRNLYSFIDLLYYTSIDKYNKMKIKLGKAYLMGNKEIATDIIKRTKNTNVNISCLGLSLTEESIVKAIANRDIETVNKTLSDYYLDSSPYKYNNWFTEDDIVKDLKDTDMQEYSKIINKLEDNQTVIEYLNKIIYTHTKEDIRIYPKRYATLTDWVERIFI